MFLFMLPRAFCAGLIEAGVIQACQAEVLGRYPVLFARASLKQLFPSAAAFDYGGLPRAFCAGLIEAVIFLAGESRGVRSYPVLFARASLKQAAGDPR